MKRKILSLALVAMMIMSMIPMGAFAATLPSVTFSTTGAVVGTAVAASTTVATYAPAANIAAGSHIKLTFPAGTVLANIVAADFTIVQAAGAGAAGAATAPTAVTVDATARTIDFVVAAATRTANSDGVVTIATAAGAGGNEITHPQVATTTGAFTMAYDAAADGTYEDSGSIATVAFVAAAADRTTSVVTVKDDKTSVTADGSTTVEYTVQLNDKYYNPILAATSVYFNTSRAASDTWTLGSAGSALTQGAGNANSTASTDALGKLVLTLKSNAAGTAKVVFGLNNVANAYVPYANGTNDSTINATALGVIGSKDLTFTANSMNAVAPVVGTPNGYDVSDVLLTTSRPTQTTPVANGLEYWEVQFKAVAGNAPVAGQKVTFNLSDSNLFTDVTEKTTDSNGVAKVKVYAKKPNITTGVYNIKATAGSYTSTAVNVPFVENTVYKIVLDDDDNQVVAKDQTAGFDIQLLDSFGNIIKLPLGGGAAAYNTIVTTTVVTEPSGSSISLPLASRTDDAGDMWIETSTLSKEGKYVVRASLSNGNKVDITFTVKEQGKITDLEYTYKETFLALNKTSQAPTFKRIDANGVKKTVTLPATGSISFATSDASLATVTTAGLVTMTNDKDDIGKEVIIYATDKDNNITKSWTMKVGGTLATLKAVPAATATVGSNVAVDVQMMDNKGNMSSGIVTPATSTITVVTKPEGAIVGSEESTNFSADLNKKGHATINVNSNKAGKATFRLTVLDGSVPAIPYTTEFTVDFGAAATVANKSIVLTIGSTVAVSNNTVAALDLAPFIKDGRTFVPVSFVTAQLGGKADFTKKADGTVDTVTITVGKTVATIKIGETAIKVVTDGKETTVTSDAAAYIKAGRTVLPFRALSDAIGAKASYGMKADNSGVEWVKFEQ